MIENNLFKDKKENLYTHFNIYWIIFYIYLLIIKNKFLFKVNSTFFLNIYFLIKLFKM